MKEGFTESRTRVFGHHSLSQPLPSDEFKFDRNFCLKDILNNPDDSDIGCFLAVDSRYLYYIRQKTKHHHFPPDNETISKNVLNEHVKKIEPKIYVRHKNIICDWTD